MSACAKYSWVIVSGCGNICRTRMLPVCHMLQACAYFIDGRPHQEYSLKP
jgi:hypothetical protein